MINEGPGDVSWITKGYDRITPENIKDFVITYESNGKIYLNLDWPKFGGYKIETIKSIEELSGKIHVSRDGGDGGAGQINTPINIKDLEQIGIVKNIGGW